ncbi:MAG: OadG family protein [Clostridia bacterium]|nr:OadG family protein [Clostridia bacterium]
MTLNPIFLSDTVAYNEPMSFADAIPFGVQTVLLGMGVVFAVLIILWVVLSAFKLVFYKGSDKKEAPTKASPVTAPVQPTPVAAKTDDAELVAAITAAIAVVMDKPETSFRVVSFRRTASK